MWMTVKFCRLFRLLWTVWVLMRHLSMLTEVITRIHHSSGSRWTTMVAMVAMVAIPRPSELVYARIRYSKYTIIEMAERCHISSIIPERVDVSFRQRKRLIFNFHRTYTVVVPSIIIYLHSENGKFMVVRLQHNSRNLIWPKRIKNGKNETGWERWRIRNGKNYELYLKWWPLCFSYCALAAHYLKRFGHFLWSPKKHDQTKTSCYIINYSHLHF